MSYNYKKKDFVGSKECLMFHNKHADRELKPANNQPINQQMYEEFKKKKEFQAYQNNQIGKIIKEEN